MIVCIGMKLGKEEHGEIQYNNRRAQQQFAENELRRVATNPQVERELKEFVGMNIINMEKILEEVAEVYDPIFEQYTLEEVYPRKYWGRWEPGQSYEKYLEIQETLRRINKENTLRILMAKRGFIPVNDIICQYHLTKYQANTYLDMEVLRWCERELRRHNVPVRLVRNNIPNHPGYGEYAWQLSYD